MARAKEFESAINGRDIKFTHMKYDNGQVNIVEGSVLFNDKWKYAVWDRSGKCFSSGDRLRGFDLNVGTDRNQRNQRKPFFAAEKKASRR